MGYKTAVRLAGVGLEIFALSGLLYIIFHPDLGQDQVINRAAPYSSLIIVGIGVIGMKRWARYMVIAISFLGLVMQVMELFGSLNAKDFIQALVFLAFLIFFTWHKIEDQFV